MKTNPQSAITNLIAPIHALNIQTSNSDAGKNQSSPRPQMYAPPINREMLRDKVVARNLRWVVSDKKTEKQQEIPRDIIFNIMEYLTKEDRLALVDAVWIKGASLNPLLLLPKNLRADILRQPEIWKQACTAVSPDHIQTNTPEIGLIQASNVLRYIDKEGPMQIKAWEKIEKNWGAWTPQFEKNQQILRHLAEALPYLLTNKKIDLASLVYEKIMQNLSRLSGKDKADIEEPVIEAMIHSLHKIAMPKTRGKVMATSFAWLQSIAHSPAHTRYVLKNGSALIQHLDTPEKQSQVWNMITANWHHWNADTDKQAQVIKNLAGALSTLQPYQRQDLPSLVYEKVALHVDVLTIPEQIKVLDQLINRWPKCDEGVQERVHAMMTARLEALTFALPALSKESCEHATGIILDGIKKLSAHEFAAPEAMIKTLQEQKSRLSKPMQNRIRDMIRNEMRNHFIV